MAGWWAAPEQEAPETALPSLNLNHITGAAGPIFPKAKLKRWERWVGRNRGGRKGGAGRKCAFPPQNVLIPPLRGHKACFTQGRPCQLSVPFKGENCGGGVWWRGGGNLVLNPLRCCFTWCCRAKASFRKTPPSLRDRRETGMSGAAAQEEKKWELKCGRTHLKKSILKSANWVQFCFSVLKGHALYKMH